jgi:crotonobetainyl-CoA:carnitine CoA-transferase CaiB-like acyl-CoA transferase
MSGSNIKDKQAPLSGLKVVDLTQAWSGPICTMILGDMGAEVVKLEKPGGRGSRAVADQQEKADAGGAFLQRNKKSITLNTRSEKGKELLRRLILWGDILVENFRPGVMKQMGFDYPVVREINPRMIMVSISGYGQNGPYAPRAAWDTVGQAMGGLMSLIGPANSPPMSAGGSTADMTAGIFGALGTLLALQARQSTGLGQHVESTLTESIAFLISGALTTVSAGKAGETGIMNTRRLRPVGTFQTKDKRYICLRAHEDNHWPIMANIIGRPDLAMTPGYRTVAERLEHGEELYHLMESWVRSHSIDEVESIVDKAGLPYGRVQTIPEVLKDPQFKARSMFKDLDFFGKKLVQFAPYPLLSDTPGSIRTPSPRLGQHNEEVYCGFLGLSPEELVSLNREGAI